MSDESTTGRQGGPRFLRPTAGMPPWAPRLLVMAAVLILSILFGIWALIRLRDFVLLLVSSLFLATAFEPGITFLSKRGWRRGLAAGFMFLLVVVIAGIILGLMVPAFVEESISLINQVPSYASTISEKLGVDISVQTIQDALSAPQSELRAVAGDLAGSILGVGSAVLGTILNIFMVALFTFYMAADGPHMRRTLLARVRPDRQREVLRMWEIAIEKVGGYIYSRVLLAFLAGSLAWVAFRIMGLPYAAALAVWLGVLSQFVPVLGTYLAGALPVIIGLLERPSLGLAVLIYIIVYQQIENYLVAPRVTAHIMSLHPAVAFGSAIAGITLFGAPGGLMALPVAATLQAFLSTYFETHEVVDSELTNAPVRMDDTGEPRRSAADWLRRRREALAPGTAPEVRGPADDPSG